MPFINYATFTPRDRDQWIAEAAFYRAQKRGFMPGYALEDWLLAEVEVDFLINRAELRRKVARDPSSDR